MEGVERPHEAVVGAEEAIPPLLERQNPLGIIVEHGSDVERVLVVDDPNLGPLRRRPALHRLLLGEVRDGDGPLPRFLIETPIHVDCGTALEPKRDEIDELGFPSPVDGGLGCEWTRYEQKKERRRQHDSPCRISNSDLCHLSVYRRLSEVGG